MQHILAIVDAEEDYALLLMEFLNQHTELGFVAVAFTEPLKYREYEETHVVELLLYDEFNKDMVFEGVKAKECILLGEECKEYTEGEREVFKYQPADEIMKQLQVFCLKSGSLIKPVHKKTQQTHVVGVFSTTYESKQTLFSVALALKLAKEEKILFLSMHPFFSGRLLGCETRATLSDIVYFIKQESSNLSIKLKDCMVQLGSVDCILGMAHWSEVLDLSEKDVLELLTILSKLFCYDVIIIDFGLFAGPTVPLLSACEVVLNVGSTGNLQEEMDEEFYHQLSLIGREELMNGIVRMPLPSMVVTKELISLSKLKEGMWAQVVKEINLSELIRNREMERYGRN